MKKTLTVVAILALVATMLPAAFAQTSDQTSPSSSAPDQTSPSSSAPAASSPAASPSDSPAQTSPAQTSPAQTSPAQTSPSTSDQSGAAQGSAPGSSQAAESYTGTVVKSGDKYVLKTDTGTYQIDDQDKAKQFEGKQVKVSGNLDKATSTLHVTDIQAAMQQ